MRLTKRRIEFLHHLVELYKASEEPVHYAKVAESVGVSKWTAYDVLKELESAGFLDRSYAMKDRETGRSVVLYAPTQAAIEMFRPIRQSLSVLADMNLVREQVSHVMEALERRSVQEAQTRIIQVAPPLEHKLEFCTWMLGGLIHYMQRMDRSVQRTVIEVMKGTQKPELLLTMFVGTVSGVVIRSLAEQLDPQLSQLVQQYHECIPTLSQEEVWMLAEFVRQKLETAFQ